MTSGALFGSAAAGSGSSKNLVEFRAGKMHMKANNMVHPDKRKGQVYVYQSDGDSLMHFCWKDRTKGTVEDDLIIFPDDCEFKRISQCTTGRVYLLKFKSSNRKFFFWMQEPKSDKDEELCTKVNETLNNPPTPGSSRGGSGLGLPPELAASGLGETDIHNILGNMSQQQLMQLLGGMGGGLGGGLSSLMGGRSSSSTTQQSEPSTPRQSATSAASSTNATGSTVATTPSRSPSNAGSGNAARNVSATPATAGSGANSGAGNAAIQLSDLQNILSGFGSAPGAQTGESVDLSKAVSPEAMIPILANAEIQQRLIPYLPEGEELPKTEAELKNTIQSPQFQQAMSSFSAALASGQLGPLMGQFELGEDVANAAAQGDVEAFAKAMQESLKKKEDQNKGD